MKRVLRTTHTTVPVAVPVVMPCSSAPASRLLSPLPVAWGRVACSNARARAKASREIRHSDAPPRPFWSAHAQNHESVTCSFRRGTPSENVLDVLKDELGLDDSLKAEWFFDTQELRYLAHNKQRIQLEVGCYL